MTKLDHDVLKRTRSLLAEIDMLVAAPTVAERVERVLSCAAPADRSFCYTADDPAADFMSNVPGSPGVPGVPGRLVGLNNPCPEGCEGCDIVHDFDETHVIEPITHDVPPWFSTHEAAFSPCGASACHCINLFP